MERDVELGFESDPDRELIEDSRLYVRLDPEKPLAYHLRGIPDPHAAIRDLPIVEIWQRVGAASGELLGRGGFGNVLKEVCTHDVRGRKVGTYRAVKVIEKQFQGGEKGVKSAKAFYKEELKALAKFSSTKFRDLFVESFGWYASGNYIYITMEYLPHGDLEKYLSQPLREDETQQIASQVVRGLQWMHMLKFIHRDLKPANLLVVDRPPEKNWWVKISDFGISKRAAKGDEDFSTVLGTAGYMAPEVSPGEPGSQKAKYTRAADMWALGAICVRMMTGGPAFHPKGLHDYYHYNGPFTPDKALGESGTSPDGCDFIRKLMARTPGQRLTAEEAAAHDWINSGQAGLLAAHGTAVAPTSQPSHPVIYPEPGNRYEATASWETGAGEDTANDPTARPVRPVSPPRRAPTPPPAILLPPNKLPPNRHSSRKGVGEDTTNDPTARPVRPVSPPRRAPTPPPAIWLPSNKPPSNWHSGRKGGSPIYQTQVSRKDFGHVNINVSGETRAPEHANRHQRPDRLGPTHNLGLSPFPVLPGPTGMGGIPNIQLGTRKYDTFMGGGYWPSSYPTASEYVHQYDSGAVPPQPVGRQIQPLPPKPADLSRPAKQPTANPPANEKSTSYEDIARQQARRSRTTRPAVSKKERKQQRRDQQLREALADAPPPPRVDVVEVMGGPKKVQGGNWQEHIVLVRDHSDDEDDKDIHAQRAREYSEMVRRQRELFRKGGWAQNNTKASAPPKQEARNKEEDDGEDDEEEYDDEEDDGEEEARAQRAREYKEMERRQRELFLNAGLLPINANTKARTQPKQEAPKEEDDDEDVHAQRARDYKEMERRQRELFLGTSNLNAPQTGTRRVQERGPVKAAHTLARSAKWAVDDKADGDGGEGDGDDDVSSMASEDDGGGGDGGDGGGEGDGSIDLFGSDEERDSSDASSGEDIVMVEPSKNPAVRRTDQVADVKEMERRQRELFLNAGPGKKKQLRPIEQTLAGEGKRYLGANEKKKKVQRQAGEDLDNIKEMERRQRELFQNAGPGRKKSRW